MQITKAIMSRGIVRLLAEKDDDLSLDNVLLCQLQPSLWPRTKMSQVKTDL